MDAKAYWQQRAEQNARRVFEYADRKARLVTRWFGRAHREMERKVRDFYRRYGDGEGISPQAAKAALQDRRALSLTLEEARRLAQLYPEDPELQRLMRQSYLARAVSREEYLMMQLELLATEAYGEYANETGKSLNEAFEDSYYKGIFDYQQFIGSGNLAFNRLSVHQIQAAVETAWKGANYSQRIWGGQRHSLARYLNRIVTTGMIEGKPNGVMAAELRKAMDMSAYQARRLIRTECAQVCARADMLTYEENGTPQFQFLATLDLRTSEICREMDGKVFDVADGQPGVNMQPMHPFCRSTTVPYIPDDEFDRDATRTARNEAGETYKVPASMTYREWHKKYVESNPAELLAEKKLKNGAADAAQYQKYVALLGDDAPHSLDAMQNMKYTDGDVWNDFKAFVRYKRAYPESNRKYYEINKEIQLLRDQGLVDKRVGFATSPVPLQITRHQRHALERMFERGFGTEDAAGYVKNAVIEFRQFQGTRSAFYSRDGVTVVHRDTGAMITGWGKADFDEGTERILEVVKKHVKG